MDLSQPRVRESATGREGLGVTRPGTARARSFQGRRVERPSCEDFGLFSVLEGRPWRGVQGSRQESGEGWADRT